MAKATHALTKYVPPADSQLWPLMAEYLERRKHSWAPSSYRRVEYALRTFAVSYGRRSVAMLGPKACDKWEAEMWPQWSPHTRRTSWCHLHRFLTWMVGEGHLRRHPLADRRPPKMPYPLPVTISAPDVERLLQVTDLRTRACVALAYGAGLRRSEIAALPASAWDPVRKQIDVPPGKGKYAALLPVSDGIAEALTTYLRHHPPRVGQTLIRRDDGGPLSPSRVYQLIRGALEELGLKAAPGDGTGVHALRRSGASDLADVCPDIRLVATWLRHADLASARHYLRRIEVERLRTEVNRRDEAMNGGAA